MKINDIVKLKNGYESILDQRIPEGHCKVFIPAGTNGRIHGMVFDDDSNVKELTISFLLSPHSGLQFIINNVCPNEVDVVNHKTKTIKFLLKISPYWLKLKIAQNLTNDRLINYKNLKGLL